MSTQLAEPPTEEWSVPDADTLVERNRVRHVEALGVAGAPGGERFDRYTQMVRRLLDVPISTVTLVTEDTAWFPSISGVPDDMDLASLPRDETFCNRTISSASTTMVPDALADAQMCSIPAVAGDMGVRAYVGVPLFDRSGVVVGALCAYDTRPRNFDDDEMTMLAELASLVTDELLASADTTRARAVQQALLPTADVRAPGVAVAGMCVPAQAVGGDVYDWDVPFGTLVFSLVDVMGKGTGAALVAATVRAMLRATAVQLADAVAKRADLTTFHGVRGGLGGVVREVDRMIRRDLERTGSLVTGFVGHYEPKSGTLRYVDAGHGLTVLVRESGECRWLTSDDLPIGVDHSIGWTQQSIVLEPGDTLLCCSDGLFDLLGGTFASLRRIESLVRSCPDPRDIVAQVERLTQGEALLDDVTVLAIRRPLR